MASIALLKKTADDWLFSGEFERALYAYSAMVRLEPANAEARLRIADTLLAMGEVQRAAEVYAAVARFGTQGGHPHLALVALFVLRTLEPELGSLFETFAELYGLDSNRIGRGSRLSLSDPSQSLPPGFEIPDTFEHDTLVQSAATIGCNLDFPYAADRLPPMMLLSQLPARALCSVLLSAELKRVRQGDVLMSEGEVGTSFFLIARGAVEIQKKKAHKIDVVATLKQGAIFGEMAMLNAALRGASAVAATDADLFEFSREGLLSAGEHSAVARKTLDQFARERMLQNALTSCPIFTPFGEVERRELARHFRAIEVHTGQRVVSQGQPSGGIYIALSDGLAVFREEESTGIQEQLAKLSPGEVFGEISVLSGTPAGASIDAERTTWVLFLPRDPFLKLMDAFPDVRKAVISVAQTRQLQNSVSASEPLLIDETSGELFLDSNELFIEV